MKKLFYTTALCLLTSMLAFAQTNLLSNPGFETVTDGVPDGWTLSPTASTKVTFSVVSDTIYEGSNSLKIATISTSSSTGKVYQYIAAISGEKYDLSLWARVDYAASETGTHVYLTYQFADADGNLLETAVGTEYVYTLNQWGNIAVQTTEAPTSASYLLFQISTVRGINAHFDSASVTVASSASISEETTTSASTELSVRTESGDLVVTTEAGNTIEVYSVVGAKIQSKVAEDGETVISGLPKGQVLIVRSGNAAAKVVL
jgi:hypothetical protein